MKKNIYRLHAVFIFALTVIVTIGVLHFGLRNNIFVKAASDSSTVSPTSTTDTNKITAADFKKSIENDNRGGINVGIIQYSGYVYKDEYGEYTGYDIELISRIAQIANIKLNFIEYSNVDKATKALKSDSVDLLLNFYKTTEREKTYLFSDRTTSNNDSAIFVRSNDERFSYGNVDQLEGIKLGIQKGSSLISGYYSWSEKCGIASEISYYDSVNDMDDALDNGDVDAILIGSSSHKNYNAILKLLQRPAYIMFSSKNQSLKNQIDVAFEKVLLEDPVYEVELYNKYFASKSVESVSFSESENNYIKKHGNIKVAITDNSKPFFSIKSGKPVGIIPDYYKELSQKTGISFTYMIYDSQEDVISAVKNGKADIVGMYSGDIISANRQELSSTQNYASLNAVQITKNGMQGDVEKVAVMQFLSSTVKDELFDDDMDVELKSYDNIDESYRALMREEVDAIYCSVPVAMMLMNNYNSNLMKITALTSLNFEISAAVAVNNDMLRAIMDKAIYGSSSVFDSIITKNTYSENSMKNMIEKIPIIYLVVFVIFMTALVIALTVSLIILYRRQREKTLIYSAKAENEKKELQLAAMEKTSEEKNQFFSNISHDMRTPLNAILGFAALAENEELSVEKRNEYMSKIRSSGKLLLDLINDTLTVSKLNSGKLKINPEPVRTDELLKSIIVPVQEAAKEKNISFHVDNSEAQQRTIYADALNLQKVLLNLLTNSIKYTRPGGHVVFVIKNKKENNKLYTYFCVKDDGVGISKEFLPHIYEPFVQEKRTGFMSSGTGLGLSIVKRFVEMMGGTVEVDSKKDFGTTFTLKLFFEEADEEEKNDKKFEVVEYNRLEGRKIILCEDNELNREIALTMLSGKGIVVTTAQNGQEGLEIFRNSEEGEYSAILMDLRMPVMNGYEATKAIRSIHRIDATRIPIIAMTADAFEDDIKKCNAAGMNAHMSKPFNPTKMFQLIDEQILISESK